MPPRAKTRDDSRAPISITAVLDAVGALAAGSVRGNLYMYDTNKAGGSTGFGTEELRTRVRAGDRVLWNCLALECEAFVGIAGIEVDKSVIEPERKVYPGTDVAYWIGTVKKDDIDVVPYRIRFLVGTRTEPITTTLSPTLVG
ncbi:hypothetical protein BKM31_30965 [[Actinomadura] parvosata subsp. kistnae]|uniref:Uncharacterized protein n=2 Tax=Nonomuraea TaxID=83681 RepID=A0A1V0A547_9ACTN|nr:MULTISPECIES: hypothetical protein [unclassified Nonomuraea]AQZ65279.1 hypothetical protein BKM31_30965 [Nonomuraea sp. ATCC 55076]NJP96997.1 hypothetical protein [Nonomuraea sp. FMUSA5-5]